MYLDGIANASADIMPELIRPVRLAWECCSRFKREPYDMEAAPFTLKVRMQGRGDADPAIQVCNVDPRQGALR